MCRDIALLGDSFLIASCKWNQFVSSEEAIVRLHEVIDWEAGGRTEAKHVHRIFSKEKEDGPRKVCSNALRAILIPAVWAIVFHMPQMVM